MSNNLSVRRVKIQTLDEQGNPEGEPSFGVMASDGYESAFNDTFDSFEQLDAEIQNSRSILEIVCGNDEFSDANHEKIGYLNFYGSDWMRDY